MKTTNFNTMKKILLVLAFVVAYGLSTTNASAKVNTEKSTKVCVASDDISNFTVSEEEKDKKKKSETKTSTEKKSEAKNSTGCGEAQKKSCAASGKTCPGEKASSEKSCCGGSK